MKIKQTGKLYSVNSQQTDAYVCKIKTDITEYNALPILFVFVDGPRILKVGIPYIVGIDNVNDSRFNRLKKTWNYTETTPSDKIQKQVSSILKNATTYKTCYSWIFLNLPDDED